MTFLSRNLQSRLEKALSGVVRVTKYYLPYRTLFFWPLIVAGGRLVMRMIFNVWDMVEG